MKFDVMEFARNHILNIIFTKIMNLFALIHSINKIMGDTLTNIWYQTEENILQQFGRYYIC